MSNELNDKYIPSEIESRIYSFWEKKNYFKAEDVSSKPPFSVILPPPNVTGALHLGHALDHTIQDVLIRWKRMSGFNTLWMPGTDHAGIATQAVVEKELAKDGKSRYDLGREAFVEKVWDWKNQYGKKIVEQMKMLGDSCDWDRSVFTLDEGVSRSVRKVFVNLYEKGAIYRGNRLINWSPKLQSALSDLEVVHKEVKGSLWHIKYPLEDGRFLTVATTRPETILGDSAVCVHPEDDRYKILVGKSVNLPLTDRAIKVIADEYVDKEFGSGVVKITPAHDFNDYQIGITHELEFINILNKDGTLNELTGKYQGLTVVKAREQVVGDLEELGLIEKIEPHVHAVGHCERSGCVVEPFLSDQWFVNVSDMAIPAKRVVESGTVSFEPKSWEKTYLHWMGKIQDWCISRQLWWGHRIPAWYCEDCGHITVSETDAEACSKCESKNIYQEEDVLDTWFSSALWPFSTMGWPEETETLKTFYPTDVLVTGHDIIFFWVARMVMMGIEFNEDVPFRKVYMHGLVRDSQGRKLSKSLKNAKDPIEIISEFGADALRFTLMSQVSSGRDLKFSQQRLEGYRNFMNKVWNASKFSLTVLADLKSPAVDPNELPSRTSISTVDQWIIAKLGETEKEVEQALNNYNFAEAAQSVYHFFWHEFCDWHLEFIKPIVYGDESAEKQASLTVLAQVLDRAIKLLHPFAPFITEEIYQKLPTKTEALIIAKYPKVEDDKAWLSLGSVESLKEVDLIKEIITAIRNIRGENRIKPSIKIDVRLAPEEELAKKIIETNKELIIRLGGVKDLVIAKDGSLTKCALTPIRYNQKQIDVVIPLEGLVDITAEIERIKKNLEKNEKEEMGLSKRLSNDNFVKNAPEEVVIEGRLQLVKIQEKMKSMKESLNRLL